MDRRVAKCNIEVVFKAIQTKRNSPELRSRPRGRLQGVYIFAREKTRLQLADVIRTIGERQRLVAGQIMLKITFTELSVVEGAKTGGQSPQAADETKLGQNPALYRSEADFAGIGEPVFCLFLRLDQRVAGHEIVGGQLGASVSRITDFAGPAGEIEATEQELAPLPDVLSPRLKETECLDCPGLKALQSGPLGQLTPQPSEAVAGIELAALGCHMAHLRVGDTGCITVTSVET